MNKKERLILIILVVLLITGFFLLIRYETSPFKTPEQKATKEFYYAVMKGLSEDFKIFNVSTNNNELYYTLYFRNEEDISSSYTQVDEIYQVVLRSLSYLNTSNNNINQYSKIIFEFREKRNLPISLTCIIEKNDEIYYFSNVRSKNFCYISYLGIMTDVNNIFYSYGSIDVEDLDALIGLKSLKEIQIDATGDKEKRKKITKQMNEILPDCEVTWIG